MSTRKKIILWIISLFAIPAIILFICLLNFNALPIEISKYISWKTKDYSMSINDNSKQTLQNILNENSNKDAYSKLKPELFADFRTLTGYTNIYRSSSLNDTKRKDALSKLIEDNKIRTIIDGDENSIFEIIKNISSNEGPYLIAGSDIGIKCTIIESLINPNFWNLFNDYVQTFYNKYPKQMQEDASILASIRDMFINEFGNSIGLNNHNVQYLNLCRYSKKYLTENGLDNETLNKAMRNLNAE